MARRLLLAQSALDGTGMVWPTICSAVCFAPPPSIRIFKKIRKIQKGVSIERWRQHGEAALEISSTRRSRKPQRIWAALTGGLVFAPGRFTFNSETKIIYAKYDAGAYTAEGIRQAECAFPVPETYSLMVNLNSLFDVIGISRRWA